MAQYPCSDAEFAYAKKLRLKASDTRRVFFNRLRAQLSEKARSMSGNDFKVMHLLLFGFCNARSLQCNPPVDLIAEKLGGSVRTVQRALRALSAANLIFVRMHKGRGRRNEFLFNWDLAVDQGGGAPASPRKFYEGKAETTSENTSNVARKCVTADGPLIKTPKRATNTYSGPIRVPVQSSEAAAWSRWLEEAYRVSLHQVADLSRCAELYFLPLRTPPASKSESRHVGQWVNRQLEIKA